MIEFNSKHNSLSAARLFDQEDSLRKFRDEFHFPEVPTGEDSLYFCGHSLGLMPKKTEEYLQAELDDWKTHGVEGHFRAKHPWLPYHENITSSFAKLVGAKESEVVAMNTLTVNLHMMMVSFYRPTKQRFKILIENNTFPSDKYGADSQARFHGFNPKEAIIELKPGPNGKTVDPQSILEQIEELGEELALVMLGNCNYLSGQCFDMKEITKKAHSVGAMVGFNLAHGAGNLLMNLHDWNVDFAVWCSYKYLNSGPGGLAGAFIHENHLGKIDIPRFEGWWGTNKETRFKMGPDFDPIPTAEAWQLSNPPIFQLASLRSSMSLFDQATMPEIRKKGDHLTAYLEYLLQENCSDVCEIITPALQEGKQMRGSMLCLKMKNDPKTLVEVFGKKGVILDFREPDILRVCPAPLYNSYEDVFKLVKIIQENA
jgi:kynureninase